MLIIETAFSDREKELAQRSQHLSPVLATADHYRCRSRAI
jgi:hypothetical protein